MGHKCCSDHNASKGHGDHAAHGHEAHGHEVHDHANHHEMMARDFKRRFFVALVVAVPVLILSPSIQQWFGFSLPAFQGQGMVLFALASVIALYGAYPFYTGAKDELKKGRWGMMTLVSLAVLAGYLYSAATTFFIDAPGFYWEISTLVLVLLLGHWLEMRAVIGAGGALRELVKLIPPTAHRIRKDGSVEEVETSELQKWDKLLVRPGAKVPIDGVVLEGSSSVNESMITGESNPVLKEKGDEVIGGTINGDGSLTVRVTKVGEETALSQIIELVRRTQASKPRTQRLADKAAHYLTIIAIVAGTLTFVTWNFIFAQGLLFALTLTITVIVITCPHALGLAIPTVTTITTTKAAENGILISDMEGLERARDVEYVIFDKTGTLTTGEFRVTDIFVAPGRDERDVLRTAASLDANSEHVIAQGIVKSAKEEKLSLEPVTDYRAIPGKGSQGKLSGEHTYVGNKTLMDEFGLSTKSVENRATESGAQGKTVVYVASGKEVIGALALADTIREESKEAVDLLHRGGIKVAMLTGDVEDAATRVANVLGVDAYFAHVLPEEKVSKVRELQEKGFSVMMVGDGVNDAPALIQADVGVAIGAGTDVAVSSAEVVLVKNNPLDVVKLIMLSRKTMAKMRENLLWATGYNVVAIPLAAGVLYNWGVVLRPEWGALTMTASSIIVVLNALLLKRYPLRSNN